MLIVLGGVNNSELWCEGLCSMEEKEWMLVIIIDLGT
jgi:hypothetical protein